MMMDKQQNPIVQLDGTNYAYWSYLMQNHLKGLKLQKYITGIVKIPDELTQHLRNMILILEELFP